MSNPFGILVYLDEILVRNLSSLVLTGFIETITRTQAFDRTLSAGFHEGDRIENSNQGSVTRIERKGFKDKNELDANNNFEHHQIEKEIDARQCVREERQVKTTYTTFVLNGSLINYFNENKQLQHKNERDIENNNIYPGDLIEIEGTITNKSIMSYIETLINLITIFGAEYLDDLTKECNVKINFSMCLKMLTYMKSILENNNTTDLIMKCGSGTIILNVNKDNFMNNKFNIFDNINCPCRVIGKVIKTCTEEHDSISLLRKTGQEQFYEKFFEQFTPLIECLEKNDIFVPECPDLRINECAIQIMPLNIYM
ncbi:DUF6414 family protein [Clostridium beijerinckii]|uniref:Uncharacterized protein n=1 Tax=Clostridium beijerinckii TaxID=1520 RepID=A0A1S8SWN7_CLOBE|nr:hypothetical protein [Clostridium beijerinckii]MBA8936922.1 hypothetical protein [Clostridium beijerinckii]NMF05533.1 hypothetical protein [Clostridium beijerinckii]NRT33685.1 hypothetical protein [Clostridium beijerinckii]NRT70487.1 hypothetical protein [Clostridium beijerinckii]NRT89025.1 hypothetical protein [Clostridium beijerinckii]